MSFLRLPLTRRRLVARIRVAWAARYSMELRLAIMAALASSAARFALAGLIAGREILLGALLSQVISNVPAAVLLSGFTESGRELLIGVNIGGLGTPVASLASLISLKLYGQSSGAQSGKFMAVFLAVNFALLALLLCFAQLVM